MTILCYHTVDGGWRSACAIEPQQFEAHCAWLAANRLVVSLPDAVAAIEQRGRLPRRTVALTFDDGLSGVHEHALPVLRHYGFPATVFVVAETLTEEGKAVDWIDPPPARPATPLTLDQLGELQEAGIEIQSHSFSHHDLTTLAPDVCVKDLRESRELLESLTRRPVRYVAYPRGRHDAVVRGAAERAGYTHGFTLPQNREAGGAFAVKRVGIFPGNGTAALRIKTHPRYLSVRCSRLFPLLAALNELRRGRAATP